MQWTNCLLPATGGSAVRPGGATRVFPPKQNILLKQNGKRNVYFAKISQNFAERIQLFRQNFAEILHVAWTRSMDMQHGLAAYTCSMDMQHWHAARTCSMEM
jgi:hypothetical protein